MHRIASRVPQQEPSLASFILLLLGICFAACAVGGVSRGWAFASTKVELLGPVDVKVYMGWWNASASASVPIGQYHPGFEVEAEGAKWFGGATCGVLLLSCLLSVYFLGLVLAEYCCASLISQLEVNKQRKFRVAMCTASLLYLVSVGLYLGLTIALYRKVEHEFQVKVIARPDWAFLMAVLAATCWLALSALCAGSMRYSDSFYYPLLV